VRLYKDKLFTQLGSIVHKCEKMKKFIAGEGEVGWSALFDLSGLIESLDEEGSLNLNVEADFYVESDGAAEIFPPEEKTSIGGESEVQESFQIRGGIILHQIAALMGDFYLTPPLEDNTCDVRIIVTGKENAIRRYWNCHSAILSGESLLEVQYCGRCWRGRLKRIRMGRSC